MTEVNVTVLESTKVKGVAVVAFFFFLTRPRSVVPYSYAAVPLITSFVLEVKPFKTFL